MAVVVRGTNTNPIAIPERIFGPWMLIVAISRVIPPNHQQAIVRKPEAHGDQ